MNDTVGKVISCQAAVAWAPKQPLSIETIEVAPPKEHEVRIRVVATGVCHTDAHSLDGLNASTQFPVILGHEGAGIVESVGDGVTEFAVGDHVIPLYMPQCKECKLCKNPNTNICLKMHRTQFIGVMPDGTTRFTCKGKTLYHFMGTSTFSEYTVVSDISLAKVNETAPLESICLLGCAVSTGYGAALNTARVTRGSTCAIWGLGSIGLATVMGCKAAGAATIVGIDINPNKFEIAKQFGCTEFVNPKDFDGDRRTVQEVLAHKYAGGFDFTFECVGNVSTMRAALESAAVGCGVSVIVGIAADGAEISTLPMHLIAGRTWKGTAFGGWKSVDNVPKLVDLYLKKDLMIDEFITHRLRLNQINDGFELMRSGQSIRSTVNFL